MVVRVRQAMIVPSSVQGGADGCKLASHLQNTRDLCLQSVGMEKKSKGGIENGKEGGHDAVPGWHQATSESSISSIDSLPTGEFQISPSETHPPVFRKPRVCLHASESDDESFPDSTQEEFLNNKFKRPLVGGTAQPHPATSLNVDEVVPDHGSTPSDDGKDPSSRVKFMCSFGGKIFPRPLDSKLRYVGGDTKIIAVNRDTTFSELMAKMREVYSQALTLKYQLPDEDLDALVSVSSDEDLQNMVEEYDKLERTDGSSRLRVFLFPTVDYDTSLHHKDSSGDLRNSEQRYVDAVNGIPEVGSRNRVESYAGGTLPFALENLMALEVPDSWNLPRGPDAVPVAILAGHDVSSHIHRVPVAVPVSNITSRSNVTSAPSSAPSSPPLLPRQGLGKLPVLSDIHLQYHQDGLVKIASQYNILAEGNYQDNDSYGGSGASSAASQHEALYRSSDCRRGPESPPRKQHDGGHQDHSLRVEQRRISESKMPRVGSHGKLTRLNEHAEVVVPPSSSEAQQLPESHLPTAEIQRLFQQQQQSLHQAVWQHPMDPQQDNYRRADLLQSSVTPNAVLGQQGYQQHHSVMFRPGLAQGVPNHEGVYRQGDQQQQYSEDVLHLPRSVSSHAILPVVASGQSPAYHVGSAPSSPRLGFREVPSRHVPTPPMQWAFAGSTFTEQPSYGRRGNYPDQPGRAFRGSSSPPKYREQFPLADERLLRQQQTLGNQESLLHEQVPKSSQILYEATPVPQQYDLLSRPQVPLYKGLNPFQESLIGYQDHQEISDTRRQQLPLQGKDSQFISGQQHLHGLHQGSRLEYQDPLLQSVDQMACRSRFQEAQHNVGDWDLDETRLSFRVRPRPGPLDDELPVDSSSSHPREVQQASYPGLHLPETSDDLLSASMGDYAVGHIKTDRVEHPVGTGFQFRPVILPPSTLGGYSGPKVRNNLPDSSVCPRYVTRANDSDYVAPGGLRGLGNSQDLRSMFEVNGHQHTSSAMGQGLQIPPGLHRVMEERQPPSAFNPITQLQNLRLGDNVVLGSDMRWSGGLGTDDVRSDVPSQSRDLMGNLYEDRNQGLPNLAMGMRPGRLSRPSSSTNIPSLLEEEMGETSHVHSYGTQCRDASLIDDDSPRVYSSLHPYAVQATVTLENPLFSTDISRFPNTQPLMGTSVHPPVDMFLFDPTPAGSSSSEYHPLSNDEDLPNIKTTATQVSSRVGYQSGGSVSSTEVLDLSHSPVGQEEVFLGQLTMTQHMAEDMASLVLDENSSTLVKQEDVQDSAEHHHPIWPLETSPTLSPDLWENALDEAVLTEDIDNDETHTVNKDAAHETLDILVRSIQSTVSREAKVEPLEAEVEDSSGITIPDDAASEAIAHGLQTIKNADLEELRELGSGTFGTVYHGKWRGTDVAIKRIKASCFAGRPSEQERLIADFWREACNLGNLHHPNVVAFYGVVSDGPGGTLATVTEYMVNGSLKQVLQKKDRTIDRRKRLLIAMDSAFGMEYLHGKNIVHFDLKCENLLVNMRDPHRPICKVGDLGLSKVKHQTMVSGGVRGTLPWMAPELLNGSSSLVTEKVDVFSFGIVMWELLTGEEPYANMHYGAIIGGIVNNSLRPPIPTWCDPAWRSLMERCWSADSASRPSFSEIASELRAMADNLKPKSQPLQGQHPSSMQIHP